MTDDRALFDHRPIAELTDDELAAMRAELEKSRETPETLAGILALNDYNSRGLLRIVPEVAANRPLTDAGMGEAFADVYEWRLLYVPDLRAWHVYDGTRWLRDETGLDLQAAKMLIRSLIATALARGDTKRAQAFIGWERAARLAAIVTLAATEPRLVRRLEDFDADPWELNTPAGLVDIRTLEVHPHNPRQLVTKIAGASPDYGAEAPTFVRFMLETSNDRAELAAWRIARLGYQLTGCTDEQDFDQRVGTGANGKSVEQRLELAIWGEYAGSIDPAILLSADKRHGGPAPELLETRGKRLVFANETGEGDHLDAARIKTLTGQDEQAARALFSNVIVRFVPSAKIVISTNSKPLLDSVDHAMRRRVRLVPFDRVFTGAACNPRILDDLLGERDAILGELLRAAQVYAATRQLPPCPEVDAASDEYLAEQDPLARWIAARCRIDAGAITGASELFHDFRDWQEREEGSRYLWPLTRFGRALGEHGYAAVKTGGKVFRRGLALDNF